MYLNEPLQELCCILESNEDMWWRKLMIIFVFLFYLFIFDDYIW